MFNWCNWVIRWIDLVVLIPLTDLVELIDLIDLVDLVDLINLNDLIDLIAIIDRDGLIDVIDLIDLTACAHSYRTYLFPLFPLIDSPRFIRSVHFARGLVPLFRKNGGRIDTSSRCALCATPSIYSLCSFGSWARPALPKNGGRSREGGSSRCSATRIWIAKSSRNDSVDLIDLFDLI